MPLVVYPTGVVHICSLGSRTTSICTSRPAVGSLGLVSLLHAPSSRYGNIGLLRADGGRRSDSRGCRCTPVLAG